LASVAEKTMQTRTKSANNLNSKSIALGVSRVHKICSTMLCTDGNDHNCYFLNPRKMFNKKIIKLNLSGVRARLKTWSAERPSTDKDPNKGRHSTI